MVKQGKPNNKKKKDMVVLLHGLCCSSRQMRGLGRAFNQAGIADLALDYSSTSINFDQGADFLHEEIEKHKKSYHQIHFIGFSMGGIVTRRYLEKYKPENLGRVLFLGSPMRGSAFINLIDSVLSSSRLLGIGASQLADNHPYLPKKRISYEAGVIAGDKGQIPFLTDMVLGTRNDGLVCVDSTKFRGMKDFIVLPVDHYSFTDHTCVIEQSVDFITKGRFDHEKRYRREYRLPNIF